MVQYILVEINKETCEVTPVMKEGVVVKYDGEPTLPKKKGYEYKTYPLSNYSTIQGVFEAGYVDLELGHKLSFGTKIRVVRPVETSSLKPGDIIYFIGYINAVAKYTSYPSSGIHFSLHDKALLQIVEN